MKGVDIKWVRIERGGTNGIKIKEMERNRKELKSTKKTYAYHQHVVDLIRLEFLVL